MNRMRRTTPPLAVTLLIWLSGLPVGCTDDMHDQPRVDTQQVSTFFADGAGERPPVPGTIRFDADLGPPAPLPRTPELLALGRDRFIGICAPCHAQDGYGEGIVVLRGFPAPPSLHDERIRLVGDDHVLRVIEQGLGKMPPYGDILDRRERHAVLAYVRALQFSQHADAGALPRELIRRLEDGE